MNKIYKVVWCHVRQTYVVASELASRKKMTGKSSSVTKALAIGALAVATLGGVSEAARVGDDVLQFKMDQDRYLVAYWNSILRDNWETPSNNLLSSATALSPGAIAMGQGSIAGKAPANPNDTDPRDGKHAMAFGTSSIASGFSSLALSAKASAIADGAISIGHYAIASNNDSVALGVRSVASGLNATTIGHKSQATGKLSTAIGPESKSEGKNTVAIGYQSKAVGQDSVAIGAKAKADMANSVVIGVDSHGKSSTNVVIGHTAIADGDNSMALGLTAETNGANSTAFGTRAKATGSGSMSFGQDSTVSGSGSLAFGLKAVAEGTTAGSIDKDAISAMAFGQNVLAKGAGALVIGAHSQATNADSIVIGNKSSSAAVSSIVIGNQAKVVSTVLSDKGVLVHSQDTVVIGTRALADGHDGVSIGTDSKAGKIHAIAIGKTANATGIEAISIGSGSVGSGYTATALGPIAKAFGARSTALGFSANAFDHDAIALGSTSKAYGAASIAQGLNSRTNGEKSIAIGENARTGLSDLVRNDKGEVVPSEEGYHTIALGRESHANGKASLSFGAFSKTDAEGAVAVGHLAKGLGQQSVALGAQAEAAKEGSIAIGNDTEADGKRSTLVGYNAKAHGDYSTALGSSATAEKKSSVALGHLAHASNEKAYAMGEGAFASGESAYALGAGAYSGANDAFALGTGAQAYGNGAFVQGTGAIANADNSIVMGYQARTGSETLTIDKDTQKVVADPSSKYATAIGAESHAKGGYALAVGTGAKALAENAISLGYGGRADAKNAATLGLNAVASGENALAFGQSSSATAKDAAAFGSDADALGDNSSAFGAGAKANAATSVAFGSGATSNGIDSIALGNGAIARGAGTVILGAGSQTFTGVEKGIAIGQDVKVYATNGLAIGEAATVGVHAQDGIALGRRSEARGQESFASGFEAKAFGANSIALGKNALAGYSENFSTSGKHDNFVHKNSVAIGTDSQALGDSSVALGHGANAFGLGALSFGHQAIANNENSISIGHMAENAGTKSIVIGASALVHGEDSTVIAIGNEAGTEFYGSAKGSIAIGDQSKVAGEGTVAFGKNANAGGTNTVAIGSGSIATGDKVVSFGNDTLQRKLINVAEGDISETSKEAINGSQLFATNVRVEGHQANIAGINTVIGGSYDPVNNVYNAPNYKVALGADTDIATIEAGFGFIKDKLALAVAGNGLVTLSKDGNTVIFDQSRIGDATNIAFGSEAAATASPLGEGHAIALGSGAEASADFATAIGAGSLASGLGSLGLGMMATSEGVESIAIGNESSATKDLGIAIGPRAIAGEQALALGIEAKAEAEQAMAIGQGAEAGYRATSFGNHAKATGEKSLAIGNNAKVEGEGSIMIGNQTEHDNSGFGVYSAHTLALGSHVLASKEATNSLLLGNKTKVTAENAVALGEGASVSAAGSVAIGAGSMSTVTNEVSIGSDTLKRKLVNVAKGNIDNLSTDAINGSQLFAAKTEVATILGGSASVDDKGTLVAPKYSITNKEGVSVEVRNVGEALTTMNGSIVNNTQTINQINSGKVGLLVLSENKTSISLNPTLTKDVDQISLSTGTKDLKQGASTFAVGRDSHAEGRESIAMGWNSHTKGDQSIAIGRDSNTTGMGSVAVGMGAKVSGESYGGLALGSSSNATGTGAVALGFGSATKYDEALVKVSDNHYVTEKEYVQLMQDPKSAEAFSEYIAANGQTFVSEVALGHQLKNAQTGKVVSTYVRRVTGVADGVISADSDEAINGSQLFAANESIAKYLDKDAVANADGTITTPKFMGDLTVQVVQIDPTTNMPVVDANGNPVLVDAKTTGFDTVAEALDSLSNNDKALVESLGGGATINVDGSITNPHYEFKDGTAHTTVGSALNNLDGRVDEHTTNIAGNKTEINKINTGKAGLVILSDDGLTVKFNEKLMPAATNIALGLGAEGSAKGSTAIGHKAVATGLGSTSLGTNSNANTDGSIAIGKGSISGSAKLGADLETKKFSALAIGVNAKALNQRAIALGEKAESTGLRAIAVGYDAKGLGTDSMALGYQTLASAGSSMAIGSKAKALDADGMAIGRDVVASGKKSLAIGSNAVVGKIKTNAAGEIIKDANGNAQYIDAANGIAIGSNANALEDNSIAIGTDSVADIKNTVSFGNKDHQRRLVNVAAGNVSSDSTDAINGSQLHVVNTAIGGGLGTVDKDGKPVIQPTFNVTDKDGDNVAVNNVGEALETIDGNVVNNTTNITSNTNAINNIVSGAAGLVQLDEKGKTIIIDNALANKATSFNIANGETARTLTGLANGQVAAGSKDAVTGDQLHTTNQAVDAQGDQLTTIAGNVSENTTHITNNAKTLEGVAEALGGDATIGENGVLAAPNFKEALGATSDITNVNDGFKHVGGKIAGIEGNLTNIEGDITNIKSGAAGIVKTAGGQIVLDNTLANVDGAAFNLANENGTGRTLTGLANGQVAAGSKDAVTGDQLHTTNQAVDAQGNQLTTIAGNVSENTTHITNNAKTLEGVAEALGGGATIGENGVLAAPNFKEALGATSDITNVNDGFKHVGGKIAGIEGDITNIEGDITNIKSGAAGIVKTAGGQIVLDNSLANVDGAAFNLANENGTGRTLTSVVDGAVNAKSTDAINGSQLHTAKVEVADILGGGAGVNKDGVLKGPNFQDALGADNAVTTVNDGFTYLTGKNKVQDAQIANVESAIGGGLGTVDKDGNPVTQPTFKVTNKDGDNVAVNNVGEALETIDGNVVNNTNSISEIKDGKAGLLVLSDDKTAVSFNAELTQDVNKIALGKGAEATKDNAVAMGTNAKATGYAAVGMGSNSNAEGYASISMGESTSAKGYGATVVGAYSKANGDESAALGYQTTATGKSAVAVGSATQATAEKATALGAGAKATVAGSVALGAGSIADQADSVSFGSKGNERTLMNVKAGAVSSTSTDAINGSQLYAANKAVSSIVGGNTKVDADGNFVLEKNFLDGLTAKSGVTKGFKTIDEALNSLANADRALIGSLGAGANINVDGEVIKPDFKDVLGVQSNVTTVAKGFELLASGKAGLVQLSDDKKSLIINNETAKDATNFNIAGVDATGNATDRMLSGVKDGTITATSNEAINGSQLFDTNTAVSKALTGSETLDKDGKIIAPDFADSLGITGKGADGKDIVIDNVADGFANLGDRTEDLADALGGGAIVKEDGTIEAPKYDFGKDKAGNNVVHNNVGDALTDLDGRVDTNTDAIDQIKGGKSGLVQLNADGSKLVIDNKIADRATAFDFADKDGVARKLENVAEGAISASSKDAINGSQLHTAKVEVADILGGGAGVNKDGMLKAPNFQDALGADNAVTTVNEGFTYLTGKNKVQDAQIANVESAIGGGLGTVDQDGKPVTQPTFKVTNKDGDNVAVNSVGEALEMIDGNVVNNTTNITNNTNAINNIVSGAAGLVQLDEKGKTIIIDNALANKATNFNIANGETARTLTGVADGAVNAKSADAINGSQLHTAKVEVADILGGGAGVNKDGVLKAPNFQDALGADNAVTTVNDGFTYLTGKNKVQDIQIANAESVMAGVAKVLGASIGDSGVLNAPNYKEALGASDDIATVNDGFKYVKGQMTTLEESINQINSGTTGLVQLSGDKLVIDNTLAKDAKSFDISGPNNEARKLTGVADGIIAADSKEAVNGGQLHTTNQNVAQNTTNISGVANSLGGGAGVDAQGNLTPPSYSFKDGSTHTNVGSALTNLDGRVDNLDSKVDGLASGKNGLLQLKDTVDANGNKVQELGIDNTLAKDANTLNIANNDTDRLLTGVKEGAVTATSNDAINGSQLHAANKSLAEIFGGGATIDSNGKVITPEYIIGDQKYNNVGDSIKHLATSIVNGDGGVFKFSGDQIVIGDNEKAKQVTTVNIGDRVLTGVTAGRVEQGSMDAVNGGQLYDTNRQVASNTTDIRSLQNTVGHYSARLNNVEKVVHENRKVASAGVASAMAMSSIPYVEHVKYSLGMGVAAYDGESAISLGVTFKLQENGRFRLQGSYDSQNKVGIGAGIAFEL